MTNVALTVNGERREADVEPRQLLVYFLREQLGLKGTNVGCDTSSCGACTVLVDGESVKSCTVLAVQADGSEVTTIEGLAGDGELHPVQQAFQEQHGLQCGYCTPGFVMATVSLLEGASEPDGEGDQARARGQPVPVHRVPQHRARGRGRREGGRMIPAAFAYRRAASVEQAIELLGDEDAKLLAGGHSLIPALKLRIARPSVLVDVGRLDDLRYVREDGERIAIGALTRHAQLAADPVLERHCAVVAQAAALVGDPQVRHRGTIGGSLAHGDPASDLPTVLLALDADLVARGPDGERTIAASAFFNGPFETALAPREVLTEIRVPKVERGVYLKHVTPRAGLGDRRRRSGRRRRCHSGGAREHGPDAPPCPCRRGGPRERGRSCRRSPTASARAPSRRAT